MKSYNPATGSVVWEGEAATDSEINLAIDAAINALQSWKRLSFEERALLCRQYADVLKSNQNQMAATISEEMGKPLWESHTEVQAMINKVDISIEASKERLFERTMKGQASTNITRFHPYGVVAVLGPFNFPGHLPNGHIVPALLAGNTVLFKPSELTPKVGQLLVDYFRLAGLPVAVLQLVQGPKEVAQKLLEHPDISGVYFTGSVQAGQAIQKQSLQFPGRIVALEMGGNNPLVISNYSDVKAAVYLIIQSAFLTSGQRCSCARRLIVLDDSIIEPLVEATKALVTGPYTAQPEPFMGPVVSKEAATHLVRGYEQLLQSGGKVLKPLERKEAAFLSPAIVDVTGCSIADVELFGPILQVIVVKNLDEAIQCANNTQFGLTAGIVTQDTHEFERFYNEIRAGIINWNMPTTGASSHAPFGGIGCSGNARPSGYLACDYTAYPVASQQAKELHLPEKLLPGVSLL